MTCLAAYHLVAPLVRVAYFSALAATDGNFEKVGEGLVGDFGLVAEMKAM